MLEAAILDLTMPVRAILFSLFTALYHTETCLTNLCRCRNLVTIASAVAVDDIAVLLIDTITLSVVGGSFTRSSVRVDTPVMLDGEICEVQIELRVVATALVSA